MSGFAVAGLLAGFAAGVFVFALARASARRELAWEGVRPKSWLLPNVELELYD